VAKEPYAVQKRLLGSAIGDVQDLSMLKDDHFDAVLCLGGPLTHIRGQAGRDKALSELVRVAKPGAPIALSVMGYLAMLRTILLDCSENLLDHSLETLLSSGDTVGATGTVWHLFRGDELREQAESAGLTTIQMVGCEGLSTGLAEATNALHEHTAKWEQWMQIVNATCTEPAVVDLAEHILYLGRKAAGAA
jgi:ubiquinone/menaquinone biosynthesis C-methylase UbiE